MKVSPKQYAQVLLDVTQDKQGKDLESVVKDFALLLKKNNQLAQLEKILYYFGRLYNQANNLVQAEVTTAKVLNKELVIQVTEYLNKLNSKEEVEVKFTTDHKVLGGLVVRYGDRIIDHSLKTRLNQLKTSLLK